MGNVPRAGFTLVEVLIALAILGIVIAQAFAVFGAQHVTYTNTERAIEVQEDVRLLADAVLADVRMAGFMVPRIAGVASIDGGSTAADAVCASDPSKIADAQVATASARFDRAQLAAAVAASDGAVTLASLDVDSDGNADFAVDEGIIVADGLSSHCATVTGVVGNVVSFTPAAPAGFTATVATGRAVPAVIYRLVAQDLMRNALRLASDVEDLQIEFGVDADSDGQIAAGEYVHDLNGDDPLDIRALRVSVIARADREDDELITTGRPAAANRAGGPDDGFRRRRVTATVLPRNLL
jgi:prepilin-type N-terminal cleavage/methylation domain-containing protein